MYQLAFIKCYNLVQMFRGFANLTLCVVIWLRWEAKMRGFLAREPFGTMVSYLHVLFALAFEAIRDHFPIITRTKHIM